MKSLLNLIKVIPFRGRALLIRTLASFNKNLKSFPFYFNNNKFPLYLNLTDNTGINIFLNNGLNHEKGLLEILVKLSDKNLVFWDIGSNYGFYPHHFLNNDLFSEIVCFEPNPKIYDLLSLTLNTYQKFTTCNYGIGGNKGFLNFYYSNIRTDLGSFRPNANRHNTLEKKIEVNTIDYVLKFYSKPDIMKIDVEGFECEVLNGFSLLNTLYPVIIIEWIENLQEIPFIKLLNYFDKTWSYFFIGNDGYLYKEKKTICGSDLLFLSYRNPLFKKVLSLSKA